MSLLQLDRDGARWPLDNSLSKALDFWLSETYLYNMKFDDALDWYVNSHRTAEDVERVTGVSVASQRLMQKHKLFSPVPQESHTAKRLLFNDTLLRLAIVGEMNRSGIPFIPGCKIIHADMWLKEFQMTFVDPFHMFCEWDAEKKRYIRADNLPADRPGLHLAKGDPDGLYDKKKPVTAHKHDQHIEIINNRFVVSKPFIDKEGSVLGELTDDKSDFVSWYGHVFDHIVDGEKQWPTLIDDSGLWKGTASKKPLKADLRAAEFARANPTSKLSVNAGMALRAALRRLLFIDK